MPITKLHEDKPQALFVAPEDNIIDLTQTPYLESLQNVEDLPLDEFMKKAKNVEKEFQYAEKDDDKEKNKKDTMKMIYAPDRFIMGKLFRTDDLETLSDASKLTDFVRAAINNEL